MSRTAALRSRFIRYRQWASQHPRLHLLLWIAAASLIALWLLTRPGALLGPRDTTWHRMQTNKDFYVGIDPNYPPFAMWTPERIEGLEADIARELGARLGVETSLLIMGYDGLYDALFTGTVDIVIAGLTVDPVRDAWVHYTAPYFDAGQVLVSRREASYQHIRELDGKTIAVEIASPGDLAARQWQRRLRTLDIVPVTLPDEALDAVRQGDVDAALVDTVSVRQYLDDHADLVMAEKTTAPEPFVIAMRDDSFRLIEAVEEALDAMRRDGTLEELIAYWL